MNNAEFLNQAKSRYNSLVFFEIKDNFLILKTDKIYMIPLYHTYLENLNEEIYELHPTEIFQIIYMLELIYKEKLTEQETNFINKYTQKYLKLINDLTNDQEVNTTRLWCLEMPINNAYKEEFQEKPAINIITTAIDQRTNELNGSSKGNSGPKLVLEKNPNFDILPSEEIITPTDIAKAGFSTFLIIIVTVVLTLLFIVFFIIK